MKRSAQLASMSTPEMFIIPPPCSPHREDNSLLATQILPPTFQDAVSPSLGRVVSLPRDSSVMSGRSSLLRSDFHSQAQPGSVWLQKFRVCSLSLPSVLPPPFSSWEDFDFFYPFKDFASSLMSKVSTDACVFITAGLMKTQLILYRSHTQWPQFPNVLV